MTIRKFGTADDHQLEVDREDVQGLSKSAMKQSEALTDQDRRELQKENEDLG